MNVTAAFRLRFCAFFLLAAGLLFLAFNIHSRSEAFTYRSQIFSDKLGYYIYLPSTFIYSFEAGWTEEKIPLEGHARGFTISEEGRIKTKYPAGVALMQAPFWLVTHHIIAPLAGEPTDGFGPLYRATIDVAAVTYTLLALLLLWYFLRNWFAPRVAFVTLAAFALGTSILYYATVETGMSHSYSLFQASLFLWLSMRTIRSGRLSWGQAAGLGLAAGLLVLTRPTNIFLLPAFFLLNMPHPAHLAGRLRLLLRPQLLLAFAVAGLLFLPQFLYWHYAYGQWVVYSYAGETFKYASEPLLLRLWFSPHNGLFSHIPLLFGSLIGIGMLLYRRRASGVYLLTLFLGVSYLFSAWWSWNFGCGYGIRTFVDYFPLLMIPFAFLLRQLFQAPPVWRIGGLTLIALVVAFTFKNMYLYDLCFYGAHDWDWAPWWELMGRF